MLWTVLGLIATVLAIIATYHVAFRQGLFRRNKIYVNLVSPFVELESPPATDLVICALPKKTKEDVFLFWLPIRFENRSKEALHSVRIVVAVDAKLDSSWARKQLPPEVGNGFGIHREYDLMGHHHAEYLLDVVRLDQRSVVSHWISFDAKEFSKPTEASGGRESFVTDVLVAISGENIPETKRSYKLVITSYSSKIDFINEQSRELAKRFFLEGSRTLTPRDHWRRFFAQPFDGGESKRVFLHLPKFSRPLPSDNLAYVEDISDIPEYVWWENKFVVIPPLKWVGLRRRRR